MQFVKQKGGFKFDNRHFELAERLRLDPAFRVQWEADTMERLKMKARRIDSYHYKMKTKRD